MVPAKIMAVDGQAIFEYLIYKSMARGGKRQGAGRPKGSKDPNTLKAELFRAALIDKAIEEQEEIHGALLKQAKLGNVPAIKELFERIMGKAPQTLDPGDNDMEVFQFVIKRRE